MILNVTEGMLVDNGKHVSVAIVDSGFTTLPSYSKLYGPARVFDTTHGDRILSIFTALDREHPISKMELSLACYNPHTRYDGLAKALELLPPSDILSISMSWKDNNDDVRNLLESKFRTVCVPWSGEDLPYPAAYGFTTTCSDTDNRLADWCIRPNSDWKGNSYAVPAVARILAYGNGMPDSTVGESVDIPTLFSDCKNGVPEVVVKKIDRYPCPHCDRGLVIEHGTALCPYCGLPL